MKVNGGANAGHTAAGVKLNLLPSGVVESEIPHLAIGSGVVADPRKVLWEARPLERKGYSVLDRLLIDERTMVSDLTHRLLDLAEEEYRVNVLAEESRGSTGRGISAAYSEETGHWQMHFSDFLAGPNFFSRKLAQRADRACRMIQHVYRASESAWNGFFERLTAGRAAGQRRDDRGRGVRQRRSSISAGSAAPSRSRSTSTCSAPSTGAPGPSLSRNIGEVRELVLRELRAGRTIIGEFGQAYWLDKRHGFSPTSSHTFTPEFFESANIPGAAHPHLRRREGVRHQGRDAHVPDPDGRGASAEREAQAARVRDKHGQAAHGGLVRRGREGGHAAVRRLPGPDDQQA